MNQKQESISYPITVHAGYSALSREFSAVETTKRKICIVTDSHVGPLYSEEAAAALGECASKIVVYTFPAGEEHKLLSEVEKLYVFLIEQGFDRKDYLAALGGGVVGDMTGFAAATYLRGIRFIQLPTTLLSMVDSSIGGKTGVDLLRYKNMVGAFHMPSLVYINTDTLKTLDDLQFQSGMGEVIKHGLIRDEAYYHYLATHQKEIEAREHEALRQVIDGSCRIKRAVVEEDPLEQGIRALLNFGHTLGHAIEKQMNYALPHGHCVAIGAVGAAYISRQRGMLDEDTFLEVRDRLAAFGLPVGFSGITTEEILNAAKSDKKMIGGKIRFILLQKIGHAVIDDSVTEEEMKAALDYLRCDDDRK